MSRLIVIPPRKAAAPPDPDLMLWIAAWKETQNNGDLLTTVRDWSGNGNDFTAPTTAARPRFDTNVLNSQPGIWFGGNSNNNYIRRLAGFMPANSEAELMVVIKKPSSENGSGWIKFDGSGWASHITFGGTIYEAFGTTDRPGYTPTYADLVVGAIHQVQVKAGAGGFKVFLNGVQKISQGQTIKWTNQTAGTTYYQIGASSSSDKGDTQTNWYHGHILEMKIWKRALTATERNTQLAAFNARYGISYTPF